MATLQHSGAETLLHALNPHSEPSDSIVDLNRSRFHPSPLYSRDGMIAMDVLRDAWPREIPDQVRRLRIMLDDVPAEEGDLALVCRDSGELLLVDCKGVDEFFDAHTGDAAGKVDVVGVVMEQHRVYVDPSDPHRR